MDSQKLVSTLLVTAGLLATLASLSACTEKYVQPELSSEMKQGKAIVRQYCAVCHLQGLRYAPRVGSEEMWAYRIAKGEELLVENAINGINMMPPRGNNPELDDEQVRLAVRYMIFASSSPSVVQD